MTIKKTRIKRKPKETFEMINLYVNKGLSVEEIAIEVGCKVSWARQFIHKFYTKFHDIVETECLLASHNADLVPSAKPKVTLFKSQSKLDKDISTSFLEKLSGPEDALLTEEEVIFCRLLIYEGDEKKALMDSGLGGGLSSVESQARRPRQLRIIMLKQKKNSEK